MRSRNAEAFRLKKQCWSWSRSRGRSRMFTSMAWFTRTYRQRRRTWLPSEASSSRGSIANEKELRQTRSRALGSTPAALLAGDSALEQNFDLVSAGSVDGLDYVDAKPKAADTGFAYVRIGFANNLPRVMELKDAFGNVTTLRFEGFGRNHAIDAGQFRFVPPKEADVVGEGG